MTTRVWSAGTTYAPGELVAPVINVSTLVAAIANAGFEEGDTDWTKGTGWAIDTSNPFLGSYSARHNGTGTSRIAFATPVACSPGDSFTASCYYNQGSSPRNRNIARMVITWQDAGNVTLSEVEGDELLSTDAGPRWQRLTVTGTAPADAAYVLVSVEVEKLDATNVWADQVSWNFVPNSDTLGLIYKAVQDAPGTSGTAEPDWPTVVGNTVVDGEVTWEAVETSRVIWQASPILTSGAVEPNWPTVPGAVVVDGNIAWECISRRIEDERCPHGPYVAIVASKVYCADDDIIRYSATANPLDWSTAEDAGFLPYGLQQYGANPITALGIYRSNLVAFNSQGFQMWQVDEDPANSALLDSMPIGTIHHWALTPVSNDLFFLSDQGVRTVGIAGASTNLQAGDVGMPVDPIVQPAVDLAAARGTRPLGAYLPGYGQYWLALPDGNIVLIGNIPDGRVGDSYSELFYALRGTPPYTYEQSAGSMPPGLSFDPETQLVTGVATTPGVFYVTLKVTDVLGKVAESPQVVTIVGPPSEFLVSHPYPVEVIESMTASASFSEADLFDSLSESVNVSASVLGITMDSILNSYTVPDEGVDITVSSTGIALDQILLDYTVPNESLDITTSVTGVAINAVLLSTEYDEALNVSVSVTGVTLT